MTEPVLEIDDAGKRFGGTEALRGAELRLRRGEWLGLLGPNGAGKTTLVRAIAGRVRLDRGRIVLLGEELGAEQGASGAAARRRLGVVPQDVALYPHLSAAENLEVWGLLQGVRRTHIGERVAWALDWTGLRDRSREPVARLSGGMKRRLNLACGVLHRPEVVLLDEPTVGVDPQSRARIWEMLGELKRAGATLLHTTHQLDEAQQLCERIVIFDHGRAICAGTFDELVAATVGSGRQVKFTCGVVPDLLPAGLTRDRDSRLVASVRDVAHDLPRVLEELDRAGARVLDLEIEAASLHSVFLHLTGRELRE